MSRLQQLVSTAQMQLDERIREVVGSRRLGGSQVTLLGQGPLHVHNSWEYVIQYTSVNKHFRSGFVVFP